MTAPVAYEDAHLFVDFERRTASLDSRPIVLTDKEFDLLAFMIHHARMVVSPAELLRLVWGYSVEARTRTFDVHLSRLRKALAPYGEVYLERVVRMGCRFQPSHELLRLSA